MIKKCLVWLLAILLLTSLMTGCAGNKKETAEENQSEAQAASEENATDSGDIDSEELEEALEDAGKALSLLATEGWPIDRVPTDLPEYTEGKIINSGGIDSELYIKISETDEDKLNSYLEELRKSGWNVSDSKDPEIRKGIYDINFDWQGDMLQMVIYKSEVSSWPQEKLPPDIFPPENCTLIGEVEIIENYENAWYFSYQCDGVDEAAVNTYIQKLIDNGWQGDSSMVNKDFNWKGNNYSASIEVYEIVGNSSTFTCNYAIITE